jgi:hypothetical protein
VPGAPDPEYVLARSVLLDLGEEIAADVTDEALSFLRDLFSEPPRPGCQMAARAAAPLEPEDTIAASCAFLTQDLLQAIY